MDSDERLLSYQLVKESCGGSVAGRGLIRNMVKGKPIEDIMKLTPDDILYQPRRKTDDEAMEYLRIKHLLTLQASLSAYLGQLSDKDSDLVTLDSVEHSSEQVLINSRIKLDILTSKIESCGFCS